jgi:flagellar assembly factor FliW
MEIETSRFGPLEIAEEHVLTFQAGLIGFTEHTRYSLLGDGRGVGYEWLQSLDDGKIAFVVVQPGVVKPDYHVEIQDDALHEIGFQDGDDIVVLSIVTIPPDQPEKATVNLQGPLVINATRNRGKQIILNESYPIRYPLIPEQPAVEQASDASAQTAVNT